MRARRRARGGPGWRTGLAVTLLSAALAASTGSGLDAGAAPAALPTLTFTYGANSLTATLANGTVLGPSSSIPAGTYEVIIDNPNYIDPNPTFLLSGPGVQLQTDIGGYALTSESDDETFAPSSTYGFQDIYEASTQSSFSTSAASVGSASAATTTSQASGASQQNTAAQGSASSASKSQSNASVVASSSSAASTYRGTLAGSVSTAGKLTLTVKGKGVASLEEGTYIVTVADGSTEAGFILQELSKPALALSGTSFVGTRSRRVEFTPGQWFFYPTLLATKSYFVVVRAAAT